MTTRIMQQMFSKALCVTLVAGPVSLIRPAQGQVPPAATQQSSSMTTTQAPQTAAQLTTAQLDALVAPIALYPDALVAQVLGAAAFPDQVAFANDWLTQNSALTGSALTQAVDQQSWDPSVKALTQFPTVLDDLAKNLAWASNLGEAFSNQQPAVMAAVQTMRAQAMAAGNLKSTPQIQVVQQSPQTIVIQPADPQVVYVPQYNPTVVYGGTYVVPYYTPRYVVAGAGLFFGTGINIGIGFGGGGYVGGGFGWGFHAWNCNWGGGGGTIIYNHNTYIHNTTIINNRTNYNGYHPWGPGNNGYRPGTDTHYGPNGGYHPNGYYGPNGAFHHDDAGYHPGTDTHYGPNGGYHPNGYYGPNGGFHHDVPGTGTRDQPNGGRNGDHGLIGGNGGVQHPGDASGPRGNSRGSDRPRSGMSGDGGRDRAESDRGRGSMHQAHMESSHGSGGGHRGGGGGHRR